MSASVKLDFYSRDRFHFLSSQFHTYYVCTGFVKNSFKGTSFPVPNSVIMGMQAPVVGLCLIPIIPDEPINTQGFCFFIFVVSSQVQKVKQTETRHNILLQI